jgi:hypothetical protein
MSELCEICGGIRGQLQHGLETEYCNCDITVHPMRTHGKVCMQQCQCTDKRLGTTSCILCMHKFHTKCLTDQQVDFDGKTYRCDECRQIPQNINLLVTSTSTMLNELSKLQTMVKLLSENQTNVSQQLSDMKDENQLLRKQVYDMTSKLHPGQNNSLIIGSSMIRNIDPAKLKDTSVVSISGGTISHIKDELIKSEVSVGSISIVCGGNDLDSSDHSAEEVLQEYTSLIDTAREHCNGGVVTVSSVLPRPRKNKPELQVELMH